jgi:hypothetical protein
VPILSLPIRKKYLLVGEFVLMILLTHRRKHHLEHLEITRVYF